jgi:Domain of unknown function (DUF4190)
MSSPAASLFLLRWKGTESGPLSIHEIREQLEAGEISRLHQVQVNGRWKLLDDFVELNSAPERPAEDPPPTPIHREMLTPDSKIASDDSPIFELSAMTRTSGLAIAALIVAVCGFIPYINLISWVFALALGHLAIAQIDRNSALSGRWMAVTGLVITYFLILVGITYAALVIYHRRSFF